MIQDHSRSANRLLAALPEDEYNRLKPYLFWEHPILEEKRKKKKDSQTKRRLEIEES